MDELFNFFNNLTVDQYTAFFSYVAGSAVIVTALQLLKKKFPSISGAKMISFLLGVVTVLASSADYFINASTMNAGFISTVFGDMAPKLLAAAFFVHRFAASPITKKIEESLRKKAQIKADAAAYRASVIQPSQSAVSAPAGSLFEG